MFGRSQQLLCLEEGLEVLKLQNSGDDEHQKRNKRKSNENVAGEFTLNGEALFALLQLGEIFDNLREDHMHCLHGMLHSSDILVLCAIGALLGVRIGIWADPEHDSAFGICAVTLSVEGEHETGCECRVGFVVFVIVVIVVHVGAGGGDESEFGVFGVARFGRVDCGTICGFDLDG